MESKAGHHRVELVDEPGYRFGSADPTRRYPTEIDLSGGYRPSSVHGLIVDGQPFAVVGSSDGATGVHDHSMVVIGMQVFVAVGAHVIRLTLGNTEPDWAVKVDEATSFGIHHVPEHDALIVHGELSVSRLERTGEILWSEAGADIFTGEFSLGADGVTAIDFNGRAYHFDYRTGESSGDLESPLPHP